MQSVAAFASLATLVLMACGAADGPAAGMTCEPLVYPEMVDIAEASGAAVTTVRGVPRLVVISDSGNQGAYVALDLATGARIKTGKLPLAETSDDLEGAAALDGDYIAITSAGWIYRWRYDDSLDEFVATAPPYPIATVDPSLPLNGGFGDKPPPAGSGYVCGASGVNCGRNFESICLSPNLSAAPPDACVGLVASKADGNVYCLTLPTGQNGQLVLDATRSFVVGTPGELADCSIDEQNRAWIGSNFYARNRVQVLTGWEQLPTPPTISENDEVGIGFAEGIFAASRDAATTAVVRLSDTGQPGASEAAQFVCTVR